VKIISKEKDFYDYMLAYGVDETEVFVRESFETEKSIEKGESENTIESLLKINRFRYEMNRERFNKDKTISYELGLRVVYFCGDLVPIIWIRHREKNEIWKVDFFYDKNDFLNKCNELKIENIENIIRSGIDVKTKIIKRFLEAKKSLNENEPLRMFNKWSHELKSAYYEINIMNYSKKRPMDEKYILPITVYPILKDLQFAKYKNGTQVFQEIEQYLFGELKSGEKDVVEISDKDMAIAKGHGGKYSFKKTPTKKRDKK
jgi:hypothetical protein